MKKKINIIILGLNNFSIPFIKKIIKNKNLLKIKYIITKRNIKNKLIIKKIKKKNINIIYTKNKEKLKNIKYKINKIDLGIIISYGIIIPYSIIKKTKFGFINIHGSLLPRWKGPAPIYWSLLSNDKITGITIIKINKNIDEGNIIYQKKILIEKNDNYITLVKKIQKIGCNIIIKIIKNIYNKKIKYKKQNKKYETYAKKIIKNNGLIIWKKEKAKEIERKIKAFYKWPKTFFYYLNNIFFVWSITIIKNYKNNIPGKILEYNRKGLIICTKDNPIIINIIQINNRKKVKISELFLYKPKLFIINDILN